MPNEAGQAEPMANTDVELVVTLDHETQTVVIDGMRFHFDFLRMLIDKREIGRWFRVSEHEDDSVTVEIAPASVDRTDIEKTASDFKALERFVADLFDELRHEHHPEHGYRGTDAWRADLQKRIGLLLTEIGSAHAPAVLAARPADAHG